ncbi:putative glycosyl hydrolases family protein [Neofusicoccum parvum UCRNP2]|uniref:Putative glycosyl hydrolases family protein n=1 Tax=Botryosphaeria parva (strain UCR-NP2) TaxID=1287680 RepID=R1GHK4_BOTPV|nr:putative glycosyl hydrolases family protein [Neofusicoccum parvum UCRNP2]
MPSIPHLQKNDVSHQLIVNGKPFLMLAGELQNSSLTSAEYMKEVWPKMVDTHVNTVLGCVTWEDIEPEEGKFDFKNLDQIVLDARAHGIHLVLLWFGSFKNGISTYAPGWVKTNPKRFPRAKLRKAGGELRTGDVVSIFHDEAPKADAKAFGKLLEHIKEIDEAHSTVVMVQVENETGLLGDSRDGSKYANERFAQPVPQELVDFIDSSWDSLTDDFRANFKTFRTASRKQGSWEEVFGRSKKTDELFMAYHYAHYLNRVAAAGKEKYPIPLYTNVWQNYAGDDADNNFPTIVGGGDEPGNYPSGGGVVDVLDIWQNKAKHSALTPRADVYLNEYASSCAKYRHRNQPLFIPEQRRDEYGARRVWKAFGSHQCLGTSPFGIDTLEPATNPFTRHYGLLQRTRALVLEAQRRPGASFGFFFDELPADGSGARDPSPPQKVVFGQWELSIERCFVFGKPGPGAGMVIHRGGNRFLLVGWGFQVVARSLSPRSSFTGFLRFQEKVVADEETGELRTLRNLNGDETRSGIFAMMPNEDPDYGGFPICVTIPARTMVAELEVYSIEEEE